MDNSIKTANSIILDCLRGAGDIGLTVINLAEAIGAIGQESMVQTRLYDLKIRKQVINHPNGAWTISLNNAVPDSLDPAPTPLAAQDRPALSLPGNPKFASYKNTLQEYCQKRKGAVPQYSSETESDGSRWLIGKVSFLGHVCASEGPSDVAKDAEQRAAFAALKGLGYLDKDLEYKSASNQNAGTKRKSEPSTPTIMDGSSPAKQPAKSIQINNNNTNGEINKTSKSQLNELAQKNKLNQPTYDTVHTPNGFFTTVTFNGRQFKSSECVTKKKDSEKNAAAVALSFLTNSPLAKETREETTADVNDMIKSARVGSNVMDLSLKNRLQEYCQRLKKVLPKYESSHNGDNGLYMSTCTVEGVAYEGAPARQRKEAEKNAAEAALKELGLMATNES